MITQTFHISCKKHSIAKVRDVVSVSKHNLRQYQSTEYSEEMIEVVEGSEVNILDDVKEIYDKEFTEALEEYNKGKRNDRQISNYLEYVSESKKNDVAVEVIIQTGDMEFWSDKSPEQWEAMKPLLKEQLEFVKEIVPEFKIASAVIHMDENSPHMHVIGVPVATGYKRGLSKQVAKTKVFDQERLEAIQDKMHEFVSKQMSEHPEIFEGETLKPKEKGRNSDFSKEFYLKVKQKEYEELETKCQAKEEQIEALDDTAEVIKQDIKATEQQYVDAVVNSEMKKEFMRYASLENPKTTLGKLVSGAFKKFKEWWDRTRKPEVTEKARTSILEQLREARVRADQHNEQQISKPHKTDLGMER
ncbi:plasmid recombination protein [Butyrivibrio fibrisolvens]|uniref:plasmid recombination protein n=1 Tax=Pseudobutyrivibrio ruminis TaxID=46206 RepID=UPI0004813143|nr:plasmid recombination protein [Pseudobutyrivibrio ruminis]MDC7279446.1 plasmid recombination protein [Butyrivibrio fibrisolvens]